MKKFLITLTLGAILVTAGHVGYNSLQKSDSNTGLLQAEGEPAVIITRTASGYEPKEVTIKKGDIVLWRNESGEYHWPASDLHPTHAVYPEFDPLMPISSGEEWKFKFEQVGEWKYHDHIRANKVGTVFVVE
jgi:plastocyanin